MDVFQKWLICVYFNEFKNKTNQIKKCIGPSVNMLSSQYSVVVENRIVQLRELNSEIIIFSWPSMQSSGNVRFTTVPLKALSEQT